MRSMKKTLLSVAGFLVLAALTSFIEPLSWRVAALAATLLPVLVIVARYGHGASRDLHSRLATHSETLPRLADQLKDVIQQTEQAALEINERFMNIAGRARQQLRATADILAAEPSPRPSTEQAEVRQRIAMVSEETATLSRDIQAIIVSLQFQDLTKQHIEKVIDQLQHLHRELGLMRTQLEDVNAADGGAKHAACVGQEARGRTRGRGTYGQEIPDR